jgi:hypothetical protein
MGSEAMASTSKRRTPQMKKTAIDWKVIALPESTEVSKSSKDLIHLLTASLRVASTVQTLLILARAVESAANWSPLMD